MTAGEDTRGPGSRCDACDASMAVLAGVLDPLLVGGLERVLDGSLGVRLVVAEAERLGLDRVLTLHRPRLVILGEQVSSDLLAHIKAGHPGAGLMVLATAPAWLWGTMLLEAGVSCVASNTTTADLIGVVNLLAEGNLVFLATDGTRIQRPSRGRARTLTQRETDVFEQLCMGRSDAAIALQLGMSVATVRTHVRAIRRKIDVRDRRDLVGMPAAQHITH
jgi:DNA-binding NarL/FixJ family response regulator